MSIEIDCCIPAKPDIRPISILIFNFESLWFIQSHKLIHQFIRQHFYMCEFYKNKSCCFLKFRIRFIKLIDIFRHFVKAYIDLYPPPPPKYVLYAFENVDNYGRPLTRYDKVIYLKG